MTDKNSDLTSAEKERAEWVETFQKLNEMEQNSRSGVREKMTAKIKQNPFVPIGLVVTSTVLALGLLSMKSGNKKRSQMFMRARVIAQGSTVAALLIGIVVASKTKPPES